MSAPHSSTSSTESVSYPIRVIVSDGDEHRLVTKLLDTLREWKRAGHAVRNNWFSVRIPSHSNSNSTRVEVDMDSLRSDNAQRG